MSDIENKSYDVILFGEEEYPELLGHIADPPVLLFVRGALPQGFTVGVVGSRRASHYGRQVAEKIGRDLAGVGVHIVSGLARGIDTVAHRAALEGGGTTTAVLGSGIDRIYPPENVKLAGQILQQGGAVVSEYLPGTPPLPHNFPRRNRIIAGLSRGLLVVEAHLRSGSLITARLALEENRDLFVVPGSVLKETFLGSHRLIQDGAKLVTEARDILVEYRMYLPGISSQEREITLSEDEWILYGFLDTEVPKHPDQLTQESKLAPEVVMQCLTEMDLKGVVLSVPGGLFLKKVI